MTQTEQADRPVEGFEEEGFEDEEAGLPFLEQSPVTVRAEHPQINPAVIMLVKEFLVFVFTGTDRIDPDGTVRRGTSAPWSQRGVRANGNTISQSNKLGVREFLERIDPPMFEFDGSTRLWRLNMLAYPSLTDALTEIDRLAGGV